MRTHYIGSKVTAQVKGNTLFNASRIVVALVLALSFAVVGLSSILSSKQDTAEAGIIDSILCSGDVKPIYQFFASDDFHFAIDSKSSFGNQFDEVDRNWMNRMLSFDGSDFKEVNEKILGRELYQRGVPENTDDDELKSSKFNKGTAVNPFQRFGLAGLYWTGYTGEWKYQIIDICSSSEPQDPKAGVFYEDRLPPQTPYSARAESSDIRTIQHLKSLGIDISLASMNTVANWTFNITKFMVAVTLGLIYFAFSDIVTVLGINELIGGDGTGNNGLYKQLYDGVFTPLIIVAIALTGLSILYKGIVKRQYRDSLTVLLRTIAMFFIAIIISVNPLMWISLPNNIAIVGQSILVSTMNNGLAGGNGLCAVGGTVQEENPFEDKPADVTNVEESQSFLDEAAQTMKASIGCSFWQQFLFKPWADGQFGSDWNKVWASGETPSWAPEGHDEIDNTEKNIRMVGDAAVPLGGGKKINNWAIFQLSTQTNAHSPINKDGAYGKYTSGLNNDWWRIVDAISNYQEKTIVISLDTGSETVVDRPPNNPEDPPPDSNDTPTDIVWPTTSRELSGNYSGHSGIDIRVGEGTNVFAAMGGTVTSTAKLSTSYGHHIKVLFNDGTQGVYAHLSYIGVSAGQAFNAGDILGRSGNTGNSSGPHLHFEVVKPGLSFGSEENRAFTLSWLDGAADTSGNGAIGPSAAEISVPDTTAIPDSHWDAWTGNDVSGRLLASVTSIIVAGIGMAAPLFFSALSAVYSIGISLLMAFAPVMFLFACWDGKGWTIFKGWGELVVNTTIKRIMIGFLMVLSIIFVATAIKIMENDNWWTGILLMALMSAILIKNRNKLIQAVAMVQFAGASLGGTAGNLVNKVTGITKGTAKNTGNLATMATVGAASAGFAAHKSGASKKDTMKAFMHGSKSGIGSELRNMSYQNRFLRTAMISKDARTGAIKNDHCTICGNKLDNHDMASVDQEGNFYCFSCHNDQNGDALGWNETPIEMIEETFNVAEYGEAPKEKVITQSTWDQNTGREVGNAKGFMKAANKVNTEGIPTDFDNKLANAVGLVVDDIENYKQNVANANGDRSKVQPPALPSHLEPFINVQAINKAWQTGNYDYVQEAYMMAWVLWAKTMFVDRFAETIEEFGEDNKFGKNMRAGETEAVYTVLREHIANKKADRMEGTAE